MSNFFKSHFTRSQEMSPCSELTTKFFTLSWTREAQKITSFKLNNLNKVCNKGPSSFS